MRARSATSARWVETFAPLARARFALSASAAFVQVDQCQRAAARRELERQRPPDPAPRPGDDRHPVRESLHRLILLRSPAARCARRRSLRPRSGRPALGPPCRLIRLGGAPYHARHELRLLGRPEAAAEDGARLPRGALAAAGQSRRARVGQGMEPRALEGDGPDGLAGRRGSRGVRRGRLRLPGARADRHRDRPLARADSVRPVGVPGDRGDPARRHRHAEEEVAHRAGLGPGGRHARARRGPRLPLARQPQDELRGREALREEDRRARGQRRARSRSSPRRAAPA